MNDTEKFRYHKQHFRIKKDYGNKAQGFCPCHDDKNASLSITMGRKCTLLYCHAGCRKEDIVQAAGLQMQDLFYDEKPRSPNWKAYVEAREKRKIEQFTITFLLTVVMPLQRLGLRARRLSMANCRMTDLHTV